MDRIKIFFFGVNDKYTDAGTAGAWFDNQRKIISQLVKRGILCLAVQGSSSRSCYTTHFKDLFGNQFIHRKGTTQRIRTGITDAEDIKSSLQLSVLTDRTVQSHKSNISVSYTHLNVRRTGI